MARGNISLGRAVLEMVTDLDPFNRGLDEAGKKLKKTDSDFGAIGKSAGGLGGTLGSLAGIAKTVGGALGVAFSIKQIADLAADTIAFAGRLDDLSKSTGIGTDNLQRLGFAGERVGVSVDDVSGAVVQLSKRLASGDDGAVAAVQSLGLSLDELTSMSPDKAFIEIAKAIGQVEDPMLRAKLAFDLFGRTGTQMLPLMEKGIEGVLAEADRMGAVLGQDSLKALDAFGDALGDLSLVLKVMAAEALGPVVAAFLRLLKVGDEVSKSGTKWLPPGVKEATVDLSAFSTGVQISADTLNQFATSAGGGLTKADLLANRLKALRDDALTPLTDEQKRNIKELDKLGAGHKETADLTGATEKAVKRYLDQLKEATKATKDNAAETEKAEKELEAMYSAIRKIENVLPGLAGNTGLVEQAIRDAGIRTKELNKDLAELERQGWTTAGVAKHFAGELEDLGEQVDAATIKKYSDEWAFTGPVLEDLSLKSDDFGRNLDAMTGLFGQLAQISGGAFGTVMQGLDQMGAALKQAMAAQQAFTASQASGAMATASLALSWAGFALAFPKIVAGFLEMSEAEKQALAAAREFRREIAELASAEQLLEAQRAASDTHRRSRASNLEISLVVLSDLYQSLGRSAREAERDMARVTAGDQDAMDDIRDAIADQQELIDAIHEMGFSTQDELQGIADKAKEVFDFMERSGEYSAEQLTVAWEKYAHALAVATGDAQAIAADAAEAAGFRTRAELEATADKAQETFEYMRDSGLFTAAEIEKAWKAAMDAQDEAYGSATESITDLMGEYNRLADSVSNEAPEKVMGVIEKNTRAEMEVLKKRADEQFKQMGLDGEAAAREFERILSSLNPQDVPVRVRWIIPPLPSGNVAAPTNMAHGGHGRVTSPTLFLAGAGGPEDFAFSGEHHSFGENRNTESAMLQALVDSVEGLRRDFKFTIPNTLAKASVTANAKSGK